MPSTPSSLLSYLRVVAAAWRNDPRDDAELLVRFAESQDEAAFATLVWRHGPLVWRTCRHILGNTQDAEDAFQVAFLALARKASRVAIKSLAGWLHQVARQAAMDVRSKSQRSQELELRLRAITQPKAEEGSASRADLYAALEEELAGLPERLRMPLLLHYLEGRSQVEVARLLGCGRSVLQRRMARGEAVLRERLERRGLTVGVGLVASLLTSSAAVSAVPARLIDSTARTALRSLSLPLESSTSAALAERVMKTVLVTKMKIVAVLVGVTLCLAGGGVLAYQALTGNTIEPLQPAGEPRGEVEASRQPEVTTRVDCFGDPLPAHALARMGTTRLWYGGGDGWPPSTAVAFSPDGKTLATHIKGMMVCLWDAATGKEIRRLTTKAVKGTIFSLGFSPDSKTLVTVNAWDQTVCRWEVATGKLLRKQEYQGPKRDNVEDLTVAFLPGGKMLGLGNFLKSVEKGKGMRGAYVWDIATGKEICQLSRPLKEGEGWKGSTAFSPDGKMLATIMNEEKENEKQEIERKATLTLWEIATGKEIRQLIQKDGCFDRVAFSPDGRTLASRTITMGAIEKICVWEVATGKKIHRLQAEGIGRGPLTYSPDGKTLLIGGNEKGHLWDVGAGREIRSFGCKDAQVALFSPNGKVLAVGDRVGVVRLWEVGTGKEISPRQGYRGSINSITYSSDGKTLASMGRYEEIVRLWEVATGKEIRQLAKGSRSIAFSLDGKVLASTMNDGMLHLWDTTTGEEIRRFQAEPPLFHGLATFSPDGKKLAARISNGPPDLWVWEIDTGKKIYSLSTGKQGGTVGLIAFSPDGRLLAADGKENTVSLWDAATGMPIGQLGTRERWSTQGKAGASCGFIFSLAFSPDSRILVTSSMDYDRIRVWEVASGKELWQLDGLKHNGSGYALAFSPDGLILATAAKGESAKDGSRDRRVHLWEVMSGKEIDRLIGHQAPVQTIAFSPDGKTLASGSNDLTCLVWDLASVDRPKPVPAQPLSSERLEAAWTDLAKGPTPAYAAIRALQAAPTQAIALLQARIRPVAPPADPQKLHCWIADLDANNFTVRDKARQEIEKLGEAAIPTLRQALKDRPALEARRQLQALLAELEPKLVVVSPQRLRELRAVQMLESLGTVETRQVLQAWAKGVAEARLTREAQTALARLAERSVARP